MRQPEWPWRNRVWVWGKMDGSEPEARPQAPDFGIWPTKEGSSQRGQGPRDRHRGHMDGQVVEMGSMARRHSLAVAQSAARAMKHSPKTPRRRFSVPFHTPMLPRFPIAAVTEPAGYLPRWRAGAGECGVWSLAQHFSSSPFQSHDYPPLYPQIDPDVSRGEFCGHPPKVKWSA